MRIPLMVTIRPRMLPDFSSYDKDYKWELIFNGVPSLYRTHDDAENAVLDTIEALEEVEGAVVKIFDGDMR